MAAAAASKPPLVRLFEAAAAAMNLSAGRQRIELVFDDGALTQWWSHAERRSPSELAAYEFEKHVGQNGL